MVWSVSSIARLSPSFPTPRHRKPVTTRRADLEQKESTEIVGHVLLYAHLRKLDQVVSFDDEAVSHLGATLWAPAHRGSTAAAACFHEGCTLAILKRVCFAMRSKHKMSEWFLRAYLCPKRRGRVRGCGVSIARKGKAMTTDESGPCTSSLLTFISRPASLLALHITNTPPTKAPEARWIAPH